MSKPIVNMPSKLVLTDPGPVISQPLPGGVFERRSEYWCRNELLPSLVPKAGAKDPGDGNFVLMTAPQIIAHKSGVVSRVVMESFGLPGGKVPAYYTETKQVLSTIDVPTVTNSTEDVIIDFSGAAVYAVTIGNNNLIEIADPRGKLPVYVDSPIGSATLTYYATETIFRYVSKDYPKKLRFENIIGKTPNRKRIIKVNPVNYSGLPVIVWDVVTTNFEAIPRGGVYEVTEKNSFQIFSPRGNRMNSFTWTWENNTSRK